MAFVKLDTGILNSTLWFEKDCRDVFLTALLLARPQEFTEPVKQIAVGKLEFTGFEVPAGWYGYVPAAGPGIVRIAMVAEPLGMEALRQLGEPDLQSRSQEFEGRRLIRIDGGYLVLNYIKYREKDASAADRSRRWRERQKQANVAQRFGNGDTRYSNGDTPLRNVIRHQAEAEAEAEEDSPPDATHQAPPKGSREQRGTRLTEDWHPSEDDRHFAVDLGLDPEQEGAAFRDYWTALPGARGRKLDWSKTFRNRCRELGKRSKRGNGASGETFEQRRLREIREALES